MSIELVLPSNHLILSHPLFLPSSIFPRIRVFSNQSILQIKWPNYWSFSFSISPSNEYSGLISLRIDWFDLLAVQGTLKSLLQHHNSKASILRCSDFFMVQLSHLYMTTVKTIVLRKMMKQRQSSKIKTHSSGKDPDAGEDWRQEEKGVRVDEMVGWHHWLNGHEFEQTLGIVKNREAWPCGSPWCCRDLASEE